MKYWIAYEHVNNKQPNPEAYVIVMAETAKDAENHIGTVVGFRIRKVSLAEQERLRTLHVAWELPEDDPRAQHVTHWTDSYFHGFEELS